MTVTEWIKTNSWALGPAFIVVLGLIVWIRGRFAEKFTITPIDAGIALIPFVLWMSTAGIFKKGGVAGIGSFETYASEAIVKAASKAINLQVTDLPVTDVKSERKSGLADIPKLIKSGAEALSFELGYGRYTGPAIWMYVNKLITTRNFKYVVLNNQDGSLFGVYDATKLMKELNPTDNDKLLKEFPIEPNYNRQPGENRVKNWTDFASDIKHSKLDKLKTYPGFVALNNSVKRTSDKKKVLASMEANDIDWLPVVSDPKEGYKLVGIVDRSRLTASLILDVTDQLEEKKEETKKE